MAIKKDYNWLSSKANKEALEEKLLFFKEKTGLDIKHYYDKGNFCSGFAHDHVVIEANKQIFAISDNKTIYINRNNNWEVFKYEG